MRALVIEAAEKRALVRIGEQGRPCVIPNDRGCHGELFWPLASVAHEDAVPTPPYRHEAETIIAGQRIADRLSLNEAAAAVGVSIAIDGENWTGEAHETTRSMDVKVRAIGPSGAPKGLAGR